MNEKINLRRETEAIERPVKKVVLRVLAYQHENGIDEIYFIERAEGKERHEEYQT